ncbi:MAG: tetratricopeptide repeat protein [Elusimicrobia bacterium]|nr:tetratricopeptide repeat protein [Elusimicrobiota bacterium]
MAISFLVPTFSFATESPWDSYRLYLRGLLDAYEGRPVQAMGAYQEVLRRDPNAGFLNESLADVALAAGREDVALAAAQQAVALSTSNANAYLLLGRVHLARGENNAAQIAFEEALKIDPSNVEALGWAASRRQIVDPQGARQLYEKFLISNPDADRVLSSLGEIQQKQGDYSAAEASFKKSLASDPDNAEAQLGLAGLYDVRGDTAAAIMAYETYLEGNPDTVEVLTRLGQLYYMSSRVAEAQDVLDRAVRLSPENRAVHFWRALVAQEERQWDDAVRYMEIAAKNNSEPGILLRLASYAHHQGKTKEMIRILKRLQRSQPENPDFMFYLALAYEDEGKSRSAIHWLNRALAQNPDQPDVHFHLAINWDKRKRFNQVETHLLRTIDLDPKNALALNYLGYSWVDRNVRLPEALSLIERAVALDPKNLAYRDSLGWAYFRLGRFSEAETILGRVVHPANDPVVWAHYGDVLNALGRGPEAVRAWQEGLLLSPNDRDLLKRLGENGRPTRVMPLSAPRTLLKRVEGNYRQLSALSGLANVKVKAGGRTVSGQGLFYYTRPDLFRLEVLGPFLVPQAVLVYNGQSHWSPAVSTSGEEGPWLALWGDILSGDFFKRFDDPNVEVRQEGTTLVYISTGGELRLEAREKSVVEAKTVTVGGDTVFLKFRSPREEEGLILPHGVEGQSERGEFSFTLQFSRFTVNPRLKPSLFIPVP